MGKQRREIVREPDVDEMEALLAPRKPNIKPDEIEALEARGIKLVWRTENEWADLFGKAPSTIRGYANAQKNPKFYKIGDIKGDTVYAPNPENTWTVQTFGELFDFNNPPVSGSRQVGKKKPATPAQPSLQETTIRPSLQIDQRKQKPEKERKTRTVEIPIPEHTFETAMKRMRESLKLPYAGYIPGVEPETEPSVLRPNWGYSVTSLAVTPRRPRR